jgi:hypothetical protein
VLPCCCASRTVLSAGYCAHMAGTRAERAHSDVSDEAWAASSDCAVQLRERHTPCTHSPQASTQPATPGAHQRLVGSVGRLVLLVCRGVGLDHARHMHHGFDGRLYVRVQPSCHGTQDGTAQRRRVRHPMCKGPTNMHTPTALNAGKVRRLSGQHRPGCAAVQLSMAAARVGSGNGLHVRLNTAHCVRMRGRLDTSA